MSWETRAPNRASGSSRPVSVNANRSTLPAETNCCLVRQSAKSDGENRSRSARLGLCGFPNGYQPLRFAYSGGHKERH
jgi:hypothetical protein